MVATKLADIQGLVKANRAVARLLRELTNRAKAGMTTADLDEFAQDYLEKIGAEPIFHTEAGFPAAINTSVNDAVLHGVPNSYVLQPGDVLSIDAGLRLDGYVGDSATTIPIGAIPPAKRRLLDAARGATRAGIAAAIVGNRVGDISSAMQRYAEERGYGVMRGFSGHGVGHSMHEGPSVPFVGTPGTGPALVEGLVITIEPAIVEGSPDYRIDPDGWTVRTLDGGWGAQFEHTVIVGRHGARILTAA